MHYSYRETGYYLPLNYNDSKIILLVRDPHCIFAYWEISSEKRDNFIKQFGENSWNDSKAVIKLVNVTNGEWQYIAIDDFTTSWYIKVSSANCIFTAELGRLFSNSFFVNIASSNFIHTPIKSAIADSEIYFADHKDLSAKTKVDVKVQKDQKQIVACDLGKYDYTVEKPQVGISSAELLGPSSDSFIR